MPALAVAQASIDLTIVSLLSSQITGLQTTFVGARARFFQGITTTDLDSLPNNTIASALQTMTPNLNRASSRRPTETWSLFGLVLASAPCAIEIWSYNAPGIGRRGYQFNTYFRHLDRVFVKCRNFGPEDERVQDWFELKPVG